MKRLLTFAAVLAASENKAGSYILKPIMTLC